MHLIQETLLNAETSVAASGTLRVAPVAARETVRHASPSQAPATTSALLATPDATRGSSTELTDVIVRSLIALSVGTEISDDVPLMEAGIDSLSASEVV